ncbi:MAG: Rne/Rng family ribonuclease [Coriobacteriales bacterium]|nr:Rne/Rng family ribonuclease [Coriobacteriales bacterium]
MADIVREMLISHDSSETRVALLENRELVELYVERPKRSVVGNVYLGKVSDVLPGMQAAFVDIGLEKNGFLYVDEVVSPEGVENLPRRDITDLVRSGQSLMVQVLKDPMGTKGARVTTEITLPGRFLVLMPFSEFIGVSRKLPEEERERLQAAVNPSVPEGMGVIVRTVAQGASERDLASDLDFLLRLWKRVRRQSDEALPPEVIYTEMDLGLRLVRDVFSEEYKRLVIDDKGTHQKVVSFLKKTSPNLARRVQLYKDRAPLFDAFDLQPSIEGALRRVVELPSGGYIAIDRTEALTAIDVNTGRYVGKKNLEDTIVRTNLEAADEVVKQLRLRDIGGIIVIDFIDMERAENRTQVLSRLQKALERDRTKTRVSEISRLGLVEMTRKNVTDGLWGVLTDQCPRCEGQGIVLSPDTRRISAMRRMREILRTGRGNAYLFGVNPETYELLTGPGQNTVATLRAETGKNVVIVPDDDTSPTDVKVVIEGQQGLGSFLRRAFEA